MGGLFLCLCDLWLSLWNEPLLKRLAGTLGLLYKMMCCPAILQSDYQSPNIKAKKPINIIKLITVLPLLDPSLGRTRYEEKARL